MTTPSPINVLIVDDIEENLLALEALLGRSDLRLLRARSGPEALEILLRDDVALALVDVQMPEMDGFELAELMRGTERTRHVPIIFLTAGSIDSKRHFRGYDVGAVDFLYKPIDPVMLGHKVSVFVELHRQKLERDRLSNELREMLRVNEMFVAAVSHDLRAPLSTVLTGASLLAEDMTEPTRTRVLARIRSSGERMRGMLDQLYDLARARLAGGIVLDRTDVDFRVLADRIVGDLRVAFPERDIAVRYADVSMRGKWDEQRLGQVLSNLVSNALTHGAPMAPVRVEVAGDRAVLTLSVKNDGEIPADVQKTIFEPFRRANPTASSGLGLGLYIVRQIVTAHGGHIELRSGREEGTVFRVALPRSGE